MLSEQSKILLSDYLDIETTEILDKKNIYTTEELLTRSEMPVHDEQFYVFGTALRNRLLSRKQSSNSDFLATAKFLEVSQLSDLFNSDEEEPNLSEDDQPSQRKLPTPPLKPKKIEPVKPAPKEEPKIEEEPPELEEPLEPEEPVSHFSNGAPVVPIVYHRRKNVDVFFSDFSPTVNVMSTEELREKVAKYFEKI